MFPHVVQPLNNPFRFTSTIQNSVDIDELPLDKIINRERKSLDEHAMIIFRYFVNPCKKQERTDIGLNTDQKVIAEPSAILIINLPSIPQVVSGRLKNPDFHSVLS